MPSHLKVITGNRSRKPIRKEPKPRLARKLPPPPAWMPVAAKREWERITPELMAIGLLTPLDYAPLSSYCLLVARIVQAEATFKEITKEDKLTKGLLVNSPAGGVLANPLVNVSAKAMAEMLRFAEHFGMTPSARSRLEAHRLAESATDEEKDDKDLSEFFGS